MTETFLPVFNAVLSMIIPFFIGMLYYKFLKPEDTFPKNISAFLFNIAYPATAFNSIFKADFSSVSGDLFTCMVVGTVFFSVSYVCGIFLAKMMTTNKKKRAIINFSILFPNFVFMAYPVITMLFGADKLIYATAFNLFGMLLMPSLGCFIISSAKEESQVFRFSKSYILNPPTIALAIAILLKLCHITLYEPVFNVINLFDGTTSILSMFMGGMLLIRGGFGNVLKQKEAYWVVVFRLLILPAILAVVCFVIGLPEEISLIITLIIAMPVATNCVMYSENFRTEPTYASGMVFLSSVLSLITCPAIYYLAKLFLFS